MSKRLSKREATVLKRIKYGRYGMDFSEAVSLEKRGLITIDAGNPPDSGNITIALTDEGEAMLAERERSQ